jgi:predicted nucleic acid-binding protein
MPHEVNHRRYQFHPGRHYNEDLFRTAAILEQYIDARFDFVDASVIVMAERLGIKRILTLDRRDFEMVRPAHIPHFELLPG